MSKLTVLTGFDYTAMNMLYVVTSVICSRPSSLPDGSTKDVVITARRRTGMNLRTVLFIKQTNPKGINDGNYRNPSTLQMLRLLILTEVGRSERQGLIRTSTGFAQWWMFTDAGRLITPPPASHCWYHFVSSADLGPVTRNKCVQSLVTMHSICYIQR